MINRDFLVKLNARCERAIVLAIQWGSAALLFIPLVTTRDTLFFYIFGKMVFFQIGVEIIFFLWLFLALVKKKYRPCFRHPLVASLLAFLGIVTITSLFGIDPERSFWSSQERATGINALMHLVAWCIVLLSTLREWREWRFILRAGLIANTLVGLYGIGQRLGVNVLLPDLSTIRLSSTLGNPIYLGVYALLFIGIAAILFSREKNNLWKLAYSLSIAFNVYLMIESASRGVTLALMVSVFGLAVACLMIMPRGTWKNRIQTSLVSVVAVLAIFVGLLYTPIGKGWAADHLPTFFADRLIYHPFDDPGRRALWTIAFKGFLDRPLTGWGWENFNYVNDFYAQYFSRVSSNPWNDRSHNQILDIFVMAGVFGGGAYLLLWAMLARILIKKIRGQKHFFEKLPIVILLALFSAYFLQNLTVFDSPAPIIVFYLLLGFAYFLATERPEFEILSGAAAFERKRDREGDAESARQPFPLWGFAAFPAALALAGIAAWSLNLSHFQASHAGIRLLYDVGRVNVDESIAGFSNLFARGSFTRHELREQLAETYDNFQANPYIPLQDKEKLMRFIVAQMEATQRERPRDFRYILRLLYLYRVLPNGGAAANDTATALGEKALQLYPNRYEVPRDLADSAFFRGNTAEGLRYAQKAYEIDEHAPRSTWYLAIAYAHAGDNEKSLATAWQAMGADDGVSGYADLITILAQSIKPPVSQDMLEYFATLAAAYGREDQRFIAARNTVYTTAQSASAPAILAKQKK